MKKPATPVICELREKLQRLAEAGIDGERANAQAKLARLEAKFDFTAPVLRTEDLFAGTFWRASVATAIFTFDDADFDIANSVKWAVERATRIPCLYRDRTLLAEAEPRSAKRLGEIAKTVSTSFQALWQNMRQAPGVQPADRAAFMLGLYEGMMHEERHNSPLPSRPAPRKSRPAEGVFPEGFPKELVSFADFNRAVEKRTELDNGRVEWIRYYYKDKLIAQSAPDLNQVELRKAFYRIQAKTARAMDRAPGLRLHPYSVAVNLGKQIRFQVPLEEVQASLTSAVRAQLEEGATHEA